MNANKPEYLSAEGLAKLKAELDDLTNVKRPEIAQRIHDAKEYGDVTENAEYEDAKNEQAFVEGRIQALTTIIKNAVIIEENHSRTFVQIGSTVTIKGDRAARRSTPSWARRRPHLRRVASPTNRRSAVRCWASARATRSTVTVPAGPATYTIVSIR